jgi:hypothetical protein
MLRASLKVILRNKIKPNGVNFDKGYNLNLYQILMIVKPLIEKINPKQKSYKTIKQKLDIIIYDILKKDFSLLIQNSDTLKSFIDFFKSKVENSNKMCLITREDTFRFIRIS